MSYVDNGAQQENGNGMLAGWGRATDYARLEHAFEQAVDKTKNLKFDEKDGDWQIFLVGKKCEKCYQWLKVEHERGE